MDDAAALASARAGDPQAFRALVERHARPLFRLAYRLTGSESDAEDVVQETFLRAYTRLDQFQERSAVGSWLHRIAANAAYDVLRARKRRQARFSSFSQGEEQDAELDPVCEQPGPERLTFSAEVQARVGRVMGHMTELERSSFVLRHVEGLSIREIGDALGQSENSTKQSLLRAVRKLRRSLQAVGVVA